MNLLNLNNMPLCLNDVKQPTAGSEFNKIIKKSKTADCLWKWETRHKAESSQCTIKFTTNDMQFS